MALKNLFLKDYTGVDEDDYSVAVYSQRGVYESLYHVLDQASSPPQLPGFFISEEWKEAVTFRSWGLEDGDEGRVLSFTAQFKVVVVGKLKPLNIDDLFNLSLITLNMRHWISWDPVMTWMLTYLGLSCKSTLCNDKVKPLLWKESLTSSESEMRFTRFLDE